MNISQSNNIHFVFSSLDPENTGVIQELQFRKIMRSKQGISDTDVDEMIGGKEDMPECWLLQGFLGQLVKKLLRFEKRFKMYHE